MITKIGITNCRQDLLLMRNKCKNLASVQPTKPAHGMGGETQLKEQLLLCLERILNEESNSKLLGKGAFVVFLVSV